MRNFAASLVAAMMALACLTVAALAASGTAYQTQPVVVEVAPGEKLVVTSPDSGSTGKLWVSDLGGRDVPGLVPMAAGSTRVLGPYPTGRKVSIEPDSGSLRFNYRVFADVAVYAGLPPAAAVGAPFGFGVSGQGGVAPLTYALIGTLPAGLVFSTATGTISGIPTAAGTAAGLNITATDGFQSAALGTFSINVGSGVAVALNALQLATTSATAGSPFSSTITGQTTGSSTAATSSDGTALTVSGTSLSGTFATAGSKTITLVETLAGATGSPRTSTVSVTVSPAAATSAPGGGPQNVADHTDPNNAYLVALGG